MSKKFDIFTKGRKYISPSQADGQADEAWGDYKSDEKQEDDDETVRDK